MHAGYWGVEDELEDKILWSQPIGPCKISAYVTLLLRFLNLHIPQSSI